MELGESYLTPVYNFEMEEFHTYYVGEVAVWVHNTNCKNDAHVIARDVFENATLESMCFGEDTLLHVERLNEEGDWHVLPIKYIEVGDKVLSRCEATGEIAYKRVLKVFHHDYAVVAVIKHTAATDGLYVTAEHPIWVQGQGWTEVRQPGDEFLTYDGRGATVERVTLEGSFDEVYNLEVEDFHTYFVHTGIWVHNTKTGRFKVSRLDTSLVAEPKPDWTPLHKSEAQIRDGSLKPKQVRDLIVELEGDKVDFWLSRCRTN